MKNILFYKNNLPLLFNANNKSTMLNHIIRTYNTDLGSDLKSNSVIVDGYKTPRLNIQRNQKRLANTVVAIKLFIDNQLPDMPGRIKLALISLLSKLEMLYHIDPMRFVETCKMLSN